MPSFEHPPIARHPALQPLSRDHYVGLVHAQAVRRAADGDARDRQRAVCAFLRAWRAVLAVNMTDEESLLHPIMPVADAQRCRREHDAIRAMADQAEDQADTGAPDAEWLGQLARILHDHLRWEERDAFTRLERHATGLQLEQLLTRTEAIEATRNRQACGLE